MSHGEEWIVPLNYTMLVIAVATWLALVPFAVFLCVCLPVVVVLYWLACDKYFGMFLTLIGTPLLVLSAINLRAARGQAEEAGKTLDTLEMVWRGYEFPLFGLAAVGAIVVAGGAVVAVLCTWEAKRQKLARDPEAEKKAEEPRKRL